MSTPASRLANISNWFYDTVIVESLRKYQGAMRVSVQIRLATADDYQGFAVVANEVHEHHVECVPKVFRSVQVVVPEESFLKLINADDSDVYVADLNGRIVGYAVLLHRSTSRDMHVPRTYSFIDNFGVSKAHRRMGVGRLLFKACLNRARERGSQELELDCWEANQEAVSFYESMGMKLKRRWLSIEL
jgi:diamine N-acetyltransferase